MRNFALALGLFVLIGCTSKAQVPERLEDYPLSAENPITAWLDVSVKDLIPEPPGEDYWKSPREFEHDFGGDCEDFAIDLLYKIGPEATLVLLRDTTDPSGRTAHAVVRWHGHLWEPQYFGKAYRPGSVYVLAEYSYVVALRAAIESHRRPQ